jgi:hypothetical protein
MNAVVKQCASGVIAIALLLVTGCRQANKPSVSSQSEAAKQSAAPQEPVTAKTAFWPMYTAARKWTRDAVFLGLAPKEVPGFTNKAGKAAMWEGTFGSPSLHQYRTYSYAIASALPDIHRGVVANLRLPWGGVTRDAMPIEPSFNVDSDAAYHEAATDAATWLKKNPNKKLSALQLVNAYQFKTPVWYLMWGDKKSGYVAFIDANSGQVLKKK